MNYSHDPSVKQHVPVLVLGLDGATFDLIIPWAQEGILPNFARIMEEGAWAPLRSSIPPMTSQAWSSFATGANSGKHGIFAFETRKAGTYTWTPTSSVDRRELSFWELAGQSGRQAGVFNMPMTYPPDSIPGGYMVSGMGVPDIDVEFTWPLDLKEILLGEFEPDQLVERKRFDDPSSHISYLLRAIDNNLDVIRFLLKRHAGTDMFCGVFTVSDRAQHYYWRQMNDPSAPAQQQNAIRLVYERLDAAVGALIDENPHYSVIIASDHGFGPFHKTISVNALLGDRGWLQWVESKSNSHGIGISWRDLQRGIRRAMPGRLARWLKVHLPSRFMAQMRSSVARGVMPIDWRATKAFGVYDIGGGDAIYLNLHGREPFGTVQPGEEAENLLSNIETALRSLRDPETDLTVVEEVYRKDDLFHGDAADEAPDLVVYWRDGYCGGTPDSKFQGKIFGDNSSSDYSKQMLSGTHRLQGVLMASGHGVRRANQLPEMSIMDLAPTILHMLGLSVPESMDGRVIEELLDREIVTWPVSYSKPTELERVDRTNVYSEEEQAALEQHLRDLGYLA